jgi:hypothetical protein
MHVASSACRSFPFYLLLSFLATFLPWRVHLVKHARANTRPHIRATRRGSSRPFLKQYRAGVALELKAAFQDACAVWATRLMALLRPKQTVEGFGYPRRLVQFD